MDDLMIIELFWERDESAILETSIKYGGYCYKIAYNILQRSEDSEECVNDTYLKAWNNIPDDRPNIFPAYLGKITRNLAINIYNKLNAKKRGNGELELILNELEQCIPSGSSIETEVESQEITKAINQFLSSLKKENRIIFVRRYWYGDSVKSISLPKEYNFNYYTTYDDTYKVAQYLGEEYKKLLQMKKPIINVHGGDYSYNAEQSFDISFYDGSGSIVEQIINYNFNYVKFSCNSEGKLWIIRVNKPDLSEKIGDYPIISSEQAKELLAENRYITSVPVDFPGLEYIRKVELIYRNRNDEVFIPYYRFLVEIPPEELYIQLDNGLNNYGAYYVPAVEEQYIDIYSIYDGSFN